MISRLTVQNLKWVFPSFSLTLSARDPWKGKRKRAALAAPRQILDAPVYVPYIPHRSPVTQHVELTFPRRGRYTQEGFRVSTKFPFGLLLKAHEVATKQEILVLPNVQPTDEFYEILPLIGGEIESFFKGRGHDLYAMWIGKPPPRRSSSKCGNIRVRMSDGWCWCWTPACPRPMRKRWRSSKRG
jgi:hypothetical protein